MNSLFLERHLCRESAIRNQIRNEPSFIHDRTDDLKMIMVEWSFLQVKMQMVGYIYWGVQHD